MTPLIRKDTKVLLVITKSNWGGAQAYVHTLATELAREGAEVVVALGGTGAAGAAPGALATRLKNAGIRTIVVTAFMRDLSLLHEWRAFIELLGIIRRERPQVVHVNSSKAGGIGTLAARLARIPRIIFTSHGLAYDEARAPLARALIACATWITFCLAHRVIVLSKDNERRGKRLPFCGKKVTLIYNGIEPVAYCSREEARRARHRDGVDGREG
ncbi:MAG TPA: glycosyltransferase, partial [Candidatus Paceibacterota bacterium]|nr:glycosyltransferase [Candidatus Paceibacterota bacterium]